MRNIPFLTLLTWFVAAMLANPGLPENISVVTKLKLQVGGDNRTEVFNREF